MNEEEYLLREYWKCALEEHTKQTGNCLFGIESNVRLIAFFSKSQGKERKKRRYKREIILLSFDWGDTWHFITKRVQLNKFDQQVDEVLRNYNHNGSNPLDYFWDKMQEEVRCQLNI